MYRFVSSYLKPKGGLYNYGNIDITLQTIHDIQTQYIDGYIELSNPALTDNIFITIQDFRTLKLPHRLDHTFEYWLAYIKDATIPGSEIRPNYVTNVARARNAVQSGFDFSLCKRTLDPDASIPIGDMNDVYLRKFGVPLETLRRRSLVTVNGFMHPHVPYYDGVAIVGGGSHYKQIGDMSIGVISFSTIGDITMIPITPERLTKVKDGVLLSETAIVDIGTNLVGKSVIVVLGGYPLIASPIVAIASEESGILKIDTKRFDVVRHVNNSVGQINLESCGIVSRNPVMGIPPISSTYIKSDIMMQKYLTLPQSFVIVVDTPTLSTERESVPPSGIPHRRVTMQEPNLPIINSNGNIIEYWIDPQNGPYSIMTHPDYYKHYLYETTHPTSFDKHTRVLPVSGFQEHSLEFLKIISVEKIE